MANQKEHLFIPRLMKVLVIDFDGAVRRSKTGASTFENAEDIELMPGVEEVLWRFRDAGYLIFGISSQIGVAMGVKTVDDIDDETDTTVKLFAKNPFHVIKSSLFNVKGKIEPYCHRSLASKPNIGMLVVFESDMYERGVVVDWDNSLYIGSSDDDVICASNAKIPYMDIDYFLKEKHDISGVQTSHSK